MTPYQKPANWQPLTDADVAAALSAAKSFPAKEEVLAMNGTELLERGLRRGIALWRIEDELDWQENHGPRWAKYEVRKQRKPACGRQSRCPRGRSGGRTGEQSCDPESGRRRDRGSSGVTHSFIENEKTVNRSAKVRKDL
jgi:hypothetical protein